MLHEGAYSLESALHYRQQSHEGKGPSIFTRSGVRTFGSRLRSYAPWPCRNWYESRAETSQSKFCEPRVGARLPDKRCFAPPIALVTGVSFLQSHMYTFDAQRYWYSYSMMPTSQLTHVAPITRLIVAAKLQLMTLHSIRIQRRHTSISAPAGNPGSFRGVACIYVYRYIHITAAATKGASPGGSKHAVIRHGVSVDAALICRALSAFSRLDFLVFGNLNQSHQ